MTLAFSPIDVLLVLGLGAAGFLVVALVCAIVLGALQVVLPSTDGGAAEADRLAGADTESGEPAGAVEQLDTGADA